MSKSMKPILNTGIFLSKSIPYQGYNEFRRKKATLIGGLPAATKIVNSLSDDLKQLKEINVTPKIVPIVVGDVPESRVYIAHKVKAAAKAGISCQVQNYPSNISEEEIIEKIQLLNNDQDVHGIIVQLPLPNHINEHIVCNAVSFSKDVDGFTNQSLGHLVQGVNIDSKTSFIPCTPLAVLNILRYDVDIDFKGLNACVAGRSHNVGMPIAMILAHDANKGGLDLTTTICHRYTPPEEFTKAIKAADVLVTATGVPGLVKPEMVKPGAIIVDVGFNTTYNKSTGKIKLIGDVHPNVAEVAGWMTPVPGGVGPCTVACLLHNTVLSAKNAIQRNDKL